MLPFQMLFSSKQKVCATRAAHTEKRELRLPPNKFQAMIGFPHNNLTKLAFLPNLQSYCAQKGMVILWCKTITSAYRFRLTKEL